MSRARSAQAEERVAQGARFQARIGRQRFPIHTLLGPNLAKEVGRGEIPGLFAEATAQFVPPAVVKHMLRALG